MQPVQLSLLPDLCPAPPRQIGPGLPEQAVTKAITLMARLIAEAAAATETGVTASRGDGDE